MSDIKLDTKEVDRIAAALNTNRKAILKRAAFQMEAAMKQRAAYDTGAMTNSCYTVTEDYDGYGAAAALANSLGRETAAHPKPGGNVVANVGPCVEYAEYVEFGTSRMGAQPFVIPAGEAIAQKYNDGREWEDLVK